jgi:hypothetical protein
LTEGYVELFCDKDGHIMMMPVMLFKNTHLHIVISLKHPSKTYTRGLEDAAIQSAFSPQYQPLFMTSGTWKPLPENVVMQSKLVIPKAMSASLAALAVAHDLEPLHLRQLAQMTNHNEYIVALRPFTKNPNGFGYVPFWISCLKVNVVVDTQIQVPNNWFPLPAGRPEFVDGNLLKSGHLMYWIYQKALIKNALYLRALGVVPEEKALKVADSLAMCLAMLLSNRWVFSGFNVTDTDGTSQLMQKVSRAKAIVLAAEPDRLTSESKPGWLVRPVFRVLQWNEADIVIRDSRDSTATISIPFASLGEYFSTAIVVRKRRLLPKSLRWNRNTI